MTLNVYEEIDITPEGDTFYQAVEKCKNNWATAETDTLVGANDSSVDQGDSSVTGTLAWHISNASGNSTTVTILPGTYTVSTSVTIASTMTLTFEHGGILADDASNATLTINGYVKAGRYQIFNWTTGTGSVAGTPLNESIPASWFGTDATAITDASTLAAGANLPLSISGAWTALVSTVTIISSTTPESMNASLTFASGLSTDSAVQVGSSAAGSAPVPLQEHQIYLPTVHSWKTGTTGWAGFGTGVEVRNLYNSLLNVPNVEGFAIGLLMTAVGTDVSGKGNGYNTVYVGHLENNKVNAQLNPGASQNWVNENLFIGGRFSHLSGEGSVVAGTRHILIGPLAASYNQPNNNIFIKPSVEGDVAEAHIEIYGVRNRIVHPRIESTAAVILFSEVDTLYASRNEIGPGYMPDAVTVTESANSSKNTVRNGFWHVLAGNDDHGYFRFYPNSGSSPVISVISSQGDPYSPADTDWAFLLNEVALKLKAYGDTNNRIQIDIANGYIYFGNGTFDETGNNARLRALGAGNLLVEKTGTGDGKLLVDGGVGVGNSAAGDVTGTSKDYKVQIFDEVGNSLGYIQVYAGP